MPRQRFRPRVSNPVVDWAKIRTPNVCQLQRHERHKRRKRSVKKQISGDGDKSEGGREKLQNRHWIDHE